MTLMEQGRIEYLGRAFEQDAAAAMKARIERAFVELITNSDDSYVNLEKEGVRISGLIRIEVERRRKDRPWIVVVRDCAEGMSADEMKEKLCRAGGQTSGFEKGRAVRGLLGRGAKDVAAFGKVTFEAIKENIYSACSIDKRGNYEREKPVRATKEIREKLQVESGCGTVATIEVGPQFRAPQHATLLDHLCYH
ncbi:MAG: ATP-binding protein [Acidobacteria bacterium]|nr:ATP-binding protein [Acidobacteriota bacterium]